MYQGDASTPKGSTEFQFQTGSINFHSTNYDWLVVSGPKATYRGTGRVNNQDGYAFLVSVIDGSPDRMRMKIWNATTGSVLYDNQPGAPDAADPVRAISKGSIVVHKQ
jgi:hypothetical protein